jgi:hypothetical protein
MTKNDAPDTQASQVTSSVPFHTPLYQVIRFVTVVFVNVLPLEIWGTLENQKKILKGNLLYDVLDGNIDTHEWLKLFASL